MEEETDESEPIDYQWRARRFAGDVGHGYVAGADHDAGEHPPRFQLALGRRASPRTARASSWRTSSAIPSPSCARVMGRSRHLHRGPPARRAGLRWRVRLGGELSQQQRDETRPASGAVVGTYAVGDGPGGLLATNGNIWVANRNADTVTKLRASDGVTLGTYEVGTRPLSMATDGDTHLRHEQQQRHGDEAARVERRRCRHISGRRWPVWHRLRRGQPVGRQLRQQQRDEAEHRRDGDWYLQGWRWSTSRQSSARASFMSSTTVATV